MIETWKEDILPEIGGYAGRGGFFYGSGRERLERESADRLLEEIGKQRSSLYWGAEQAERDRQDRAAMGVLETAMTATGIEQMDLTREFDEWMRTQPEYNPSLSLALSYLSGSYMQPLVETEGPGLLTGAVSGLAQGVGTGLGIGWSSDD